MPADKRKELENAWLECGEVKPGTFSNERVVWVETEDEEGQQAYLVDANDVSQDKVRVKTEQYEGKTYAYLPTFEWSNPVIVRESALEYN